jgi:hypothetical protein
MYWKGTINPAKIGAFVAIKYQTETRFTIQLNLVF